MNPDTLGNSAPEPNSAGQGIERKGSVKRAREMLEAGRRPEFAMPPPPTLKAESAHMAQWPLPSDGVSQSNMVDPRARLLVPNRPPPQGPPPKGPPPKGPPPQRPPRPDAPSPSIYSENSVSDVAPRSINRPFPSFSQPLPHQLPARSAFRPVSAADSTPRTSVATDDLFRQSMASSIGSIPSIPDFYVSVEPNSIQRPTQKQLAPSNVNRPPVRKYAVSPIPEELPDSPSVFKGSYASSRVFPSSWGSAQAESAILGAYLDADSDDGQERRPSGGDAEVGLVRQASLGKRGKPSLTTIQKPNSPSLVPTPEERPMATTVFAKEIAVEQNGVRRSLSESSTDSSEFDLEKPPILLDVSQERTAGDYRGALEKELGGLPKAIPTMSEKRPGGRRPPRLNLNAVREAEARGSLTSLPDLIRRATKLASNLEHGRTASRNNLLNIGGPRNQGNPSRRSGSIKDILASFPPPAATPEVRSSWPDFFGRKTHLQHIQSHEPGSEKGQEEVAKRRRRCCGMPLLLFLLVCIVIIIIILVAILVPVFLVVVPQHNAVSSEPTCAQTTPCENGGVSVSSGNICSCVCGNGFTGSRCTVAGDASCTTTEINEGAISKNATMGSDLPRLFKSSSTNLSIPLDSLTLLALFSQNNVSCTTENELVAFKGISDSSKARRDLPVDVPTQTLAARAAVATTDGIVFDNSAPTQSTATTKTTQETSTATPTATSTSTSTPIPTKVLDFSRVAVLYIFEKTAVLDAAMQSEEIINTFLTDSYPSKTGVYNIDLSQSGIVGNYTLNFDEFTITSPNGVVVGGN